MNNITKSLISLVSDVDVIEEGAYNVREDGKCAKVHSSKNIQIVSKKEIGRAHV